MSSTISRNDMNVSHSTDETSRDNHSVGSHKNVMIGENCRTNDLFSAASSLAKNAREMYPTGKRKRLPHNSVRHA
jgi:hypothetical protein